MVSSVLSNSDPGARLSGPQYFVSKPVFNQPNSRSAGAARKRRIDPFTESTGHVAERSYSFQKVQFSNRNDTGCLGLLAV
jgi:hypothetical protein